MVEVWTAPFVATTNAIIASADCNAGYRGNLLWIRQFLSADPASSDQLLQSSGTSAAAWVNRATVVQGAVGSLDLTLDNTIWLKGKESGGAARGIARMDASNNLILGDANNNAQIVANALALPSATQIGGNTAWHSGNDGTGSGLDADTVDGSHASAFALAAAGVPSGLIAMVTNAAAIPSGWSRESGLNGRVPVGDDLGVTFTAENNYGAATHTHTAAALGISGNTGAPSATDGLGNGGGTTTPTATHTHNQGTLDVTGTTDATSNLPLARAYVFVKRD